MASAQRLQLHPACSLPQAHQHMPSMLALTVPLIEQRRQRQSAQAAAANPQLLL